ncbi:IMP dehydrogenase [Photobacterium aquae]|uniref:IMP dehydrogenase n=1 Tax=Photobacterium aquae TaxID=1195763 RepID=A0A0J1GZJ6_9GAMM|nr:VWA domain-containing protein [Photobacterium aquae]KLV05071.1 IMP dehydrogenase [Photobacterium aquae]
MLEFAWLWALLLLPLPLLIYRFAPARHRPSAAIRLPRLPAGVGIQQRSNRWISIFMGMAWLCLITALIRPIWYGEPIHINPEHRDIMLAVDLSGSMSIKDMDLGNGNNTDRLTAVKAVLDKFIAEREGDRIGLVLFANHAYLQTPLTFDRKTVQDQLGRTVLGLIGQSTAIGEGLGIATKTFIESDAPQRVIILLSDGANTAGVIDPLEAARLAAKSKATIYTVGVGAEEMEQRTFFSTRTVNPSQDLDERTLKRIADMTGGQYFRARNPQELEKIYDIINQLEPVNTAQQTWRPRQELFRYPLGIALLFSVVVMILRKRHE